MQDEERTGIVRDLVEYRGDPNRLAAELRRFPWDSERELITLRAGHVRRVLDGYSSSELGAGEVEDWVNAVEMRDDIGVESVAVRDAIHVLANPALEGALTGELVSRLTISLVERFPCACCGYRTLPEPSPSDEICPVCSWQDDFVANQDTDVTGPNHVTLSAARRNFAAFGASEERPKAQVRPPNPDEGPPEPWTERRDSTSAS